MECPHLDETQLIKRCLKSCISLRFTVRWLSTNTIPVIDVTR